MRTLLLGTVVALGLVVLVTSQTDRLQDVDRANCQVTTGDETCGLGDTWGERIATVREAL